MKGVHGENEKVNIHLQDRSPVPKYIFVTGGVMSGLGKGITTFVSRNSCSFRASQ